MNLKVAIFAITLGCLPLASGCERGNDGLHYPSPQLAAEQALNLQLEALSRTGNTHRGVAQMYAFASPKSRSMMGSFDAFASLILEHMTPLAGHRSSQVHVLEQNPMRVSFQVTVQDQQGEESHYEWVLESMPSADCPMCWLNTYIHPMETPVHGVTIEL